MAQHPNERDATDCPRIRGRYLVPATGEVKPARCGTYKCGYCGPRLALVTAWGIGLLLGIGGPKRLVLTALASASITAAGITGSGRGLRRRSPSS